MFEYLFVMVHQFKVQELNGQEIPFRQRVLDHEFANEVGKQGWDLAGIASGTVVGSYRMIFKRQMGSQPHMGMG